MKVLRMSEDRKLHIEQAKVPQPGTEQVLIQVHNASILNIDTQFSRSDSPLGYEASGLVVASGGCSVA